MPQLIMLNHAAHVNSKRSEAKSKVQTQKPAIERKGDVVWRGKRFDEMSSDDIVAFNAEADLELGSGR